MEELLLLLLLDLPQLLAQLVIEILWDLGSASYRKPVERSRPSAIVAAFGYFLLGAAVGGLSLLVWAGRVFRPGPVPGLSLVLSPLCVGAAMHAWGAYRRAGGTSLATFPCGAAFAFGTALVRFVWAK